MFTTASFDHAMCKQNECTSKGEREQTKQRKKMEERNNPHTYKTNKQTNKKTNHRKENEKKKDIIFIVGLHTLVTSFSVEHFSFCLIWHHLQISFLFAYCAPFFSFVLFICLFYLFFFSIPYPHFCKRRAQPEPKTSLLFTE